MDINSLLTILLPSLLITVLIILLRIAAWKLGAGAVISFIARFMLLASTFIPTAIFYYLYKPPIDMVLILVPPLFYDLLFAEEIISFTVASFGVLMFSFMLFLTLLFSMLPKPCIPTQQGQAGIQECMMKMRMYPSWLWSLIITYALTMVLGAGLINLNHYLFTLNPIYPFIPFTLAVLTIIYLVKTSGRIMPLPAPEGTT